MDKCSGVQPIRIGDILQVLLCNVLLIVVGKEATRICGTDKLCSGLETSIEGGIRHIRSLWDAQEKDDTGWDILFIDARNVFNENNIKMMLWIATRFPFDIYKRHSVLVVRRESVLHNNEGVTQ